MGKAADIGYLPTPNELTFTEYQEETQRTAIYPKDIAVLYCTVALAGETGEVCEKIKKVYRDMERHFTREKKLEIAKELGDVLWYVSQLAKELGIPLGVIAKANLTKLRERMENGKLAGSGDNR
jgi:NTP pyrophosphatase (non-canonical NTP hydrolase)